MGGVAPPVPLGPFFPPPCLRLGYLPPPGGTGTVSSSRGGGTSTYTHKPVLPPPVFVSIGGGVCPSPPPPPSFCWSWHLTVPPNFPRWPVWPLPGNWAPVRPIGSSPSGPKMPLDLTPPLDYPPPYGATTPTMSAVAMAPHMLAAAILRRPLIAPPPLPHSAFAAACGSAVAPSLLSVPQACWRCALSVPLPSLVISP